MEWNRVPVTVPPPDERTLRSGEMYPMCKICTQNECRRAPSRSFPVAGVSHRATGRYRRHKRTGQSCSPTGRPEYDTGLKPDPLQSLLTSCDVSVPPLSRVTPRESQSSCLCIQTMWGRRIDPIRRAGGPSFGLSRLPSPSKQPRIRDSFRVNAIPNYHLTNNVSSILRRLFSLIWYRTQ